MSNIIKYYDFEYDTLLAHYHDQCLAYQFRAMLHDPDDPKLSRLDKEIESIEIALYIKENKLSFTDSDIELAKMHKVMGL